MTQSPEGPRCAWCHRPLPDRPGPGRPRRFCSPAHRQRAFEARRLAARLAVPAGRSVVADGDLRRLHDRLYRLETAVADATQDLSDAPAERNYRAAYEDLLDAAGDLVGLVIEPVRE